MFFDNVRKETIYIPLLDEGTEVWRPADGLQIGQDIFVVILTSTYDPEDEKWEFPPGSVVACRKELRDGARVLVAVSQIDLDAT